MTSNTQLEDGDSLKINYAMNGECPTEKTSFAYQSIVFAHTPGLEGCAFDMILCVGARLELRNKQMIAESQDAQMC